MFLALSSAVLGCVAAEVKWGVVFSATAVFAACAPPMRSTAHAPLSPSQLKSFWEDVDPRSRDLFTGVGGPGLRPDPDVVYEVERRDPRGYSVTYDVRDPSGRRWSVKIGPEAQSEITSSRIVWAVGYRQVPSYYLPRWRYRMYGREATEGPGRFRPKVPAFTNAGTWPWHSNRFVGTQPFRGLLVLMMILNSTDLKDDNNGVFERRERHRVVDRFFVVKDLGATFGTTGTANPARNDIDAFERVGFIKGVDDRGRVQFAFRGAHAELVENLRPEDVRWICRRLERLTPSQWRDAFRAAGQPDDIAARFIAKLHEKVAQGAALGAAAASR
jgi:hypothetical protein